MKLILPLTLLSPFCTSAFAVDGYKDYKFGMSLSAVQKLNPCKLSLSKEVSERWVKAYSCEDFKFDDRKIGAAFFFVENKLLRIALGTGITHANALIALFEPLNKKYGGKPSTNPTMSDLIQFSKGKQNYVDYFWDNDTVVARIMKELGTTEDEDTSTLLIYTSPEFDTINISNSRKKVTKDDL